MANLLFTPLVGDSPSPSAKFAQLHLALARRARMTPLAAADAPEVTA